LFIEPFAGGASIGLLAGFEDYADHVCLVEYSPDVAAVWQTILNENDSTWLTHRILTFDLTRNSALQELAVKPRSTKRKAFQTILRNRVQHGGIMAPGAGMVKEGENGKGIRSRWYPETLAKRIRAITERRERFSIVCGDGLDVIDEHLDDPTVALFIDPPYTVSKKRAGGRLYTAHTLDHERLFQQAASHQGPILMTYDDDPLVRHMAADHGLGIQTVAMQNTHLARMNELLISDSFSWTRNGRPTHDQPELWPLDRSTTG
jgi:DNA adenine methylase